MLSDKERRDRRTLLEADGELFTRYFFKVIEGTKFIINQHHHILFKVLQKVINGEILRLIINIPPGYTSIVNPTKAGDLIGDGWTVDVAAHIFKRLKHEPEKV